MHDAPHAWLRGPIPGIAPALQPVACGLIQASEDLPPLLAPLTHPQLWQRPGGSAPIGYHAVHLAGSLDRLFTYARGGKLSTGQLAALAAERTLVERQPPTDEVIARLTDALAAALAQLPGFTATALCEPRAIGRAGLPSTTLGTLFHAAEHTARHAGQIATLVQVVRS